MVHYLLIPIEDSKQTLESVKILPLEVQLELADYNITGKQLAEYFQIYLKQKTLDTNIKENEELCSYAKEVVQSIISANYFIIPYIPFEEINLEIL